MILDWYNRESAVFLVEKRFSYLFNLRFIYRIVGITSDQSTFNNNSMLCKFLCNEN